MYTQAIGGCQGSAPVSDLNAAATCICARGLLCDSGDAKSFHGARSMSHANLSETLAGELGPVLLDRKVSQPDAVTTLVASVGFLIVGAVLIAAGGVGFDGSVSFTLGLGALLGLLGSVIFIVTFRTYWANRGTRQFVHERGLREESERGDLHRPRRGRRARIPGDRPL
jgi:hypothetical protein